MDDFQVHLDCFFTDEAAARAKEKAVLNERIGIPQGAPFPLLGDHVSLLAGEEWITFRVSRREFLLQGSAPEMRVLLTLDVPE